MYNNHTFSFTTKERILPVMPGDRYFYVRNHADYSICRSNPIEGVMLTEKGLLVYDTIDEEPVDLGEFSFLTYEEAKEWADAHRPDPPYSYDDLTDEWMDASYWKPEDSGAFFVRLSDGSVQEAYFDDEEETFYESDKRNAKKVDGVKAWINSRFMSLEEATEAPDFKGIADRYTPGE